MLPIVGQDIFLCKEPSTANSSPVPEYRSKVININNDSIDIHLPANLSSGKTGYLLTGTKLIVIYDIKDGSRIHCPTIVLGHSEGSFKYLRLARPKEEEMMRIQRRNFMRIPAVVDAAVQLIETGDGRRLHFIAKTEDIGGGGIAISCPKTRDLRKNDLLAVWIALPMQNGNVIHAHFSGSVVRIVPDEQQPKILQVSIKFEDILEKELQKIYQYCFEREVELRKKSVR